MNCYKHEVYVIKKISFCKEILNIGLISMHFSSCENNQLSPGIQFVYQPWRHRTDINF